MRCVEIEAVSKHKQQQVGRHVTPLGHIIMTSNQADFDFVVEYCVFLRNFIFSLIRLGIELSISPTRGWYSNN